MESKRAKYVLGFSLLAIWSLLFMRVRERVNTKNDFAIIDQGKDSNSRTISNTNYELLLTYADPFQIGKEVKRKPIPKKANRAKKKEQQRGRAKVKKAKPKKLPEYIYKGYIIVKGGKRVALVNDGIRNYNVAIGEKIKEATLTQIYADSIQVKVGEEFVTYLKFN